jgi:hypothetical protein
LRLSIFLVKYLSHQGGNFPFCHWFESKSFDTLGLNLLFGNLFFAVAPFLIIFEGLADHTLSGRMSTRQGWQLLGIGSANLST